jgi:hypothetical protein
VVAMDHLVDVVDVELPGAIPLDRFSDVFHQPCELGLVVCRYERSRDAPALLGPASRLGRHCRASISRRRLGFSLKSAAGDIVRLDKPVGRTAP